mmetsp:Transcript_4739/g.7190  ORF Transcript_4739/g.7190 Transcript_4739/m.7190 type:complete len:204 (-) Transcript_4739:313-924(-)
MPSGRRSAVRIPAGRHPAALPRAIAIAMLIMQHPHRPLAPRVAAIAVHLATAAAAVAVYRVGAVLGRVRGMPIAAARCRLVDLAVLRHHLLYGQALAAAAMVATPMAAAATVVQDLAASVARQMPLKRPMVLRQQQHRQRRDGLDLAPVTMAAASQHRHPPIHLAAAVPTPVPTRAVALLYLAALQLVPVSQQQVVADHFWRV